ncbi:hypothetical protein R3P38DRAFT_2788126 [Favolaschia claudopus]|uniref:Uncharacterized protein n=1 Tax=Favolaschia claudopus TaxID=2862362 RepID=A0AAW0AL93_9AGAR
MSVSDSSMEDLIFSQSESPMSDQEINHTDFPFATGTLPSTRCSHPRLVLSTAEFEAIYRHGVSNGTQPFICWTFLTSDRIQAIAKRLQSIKSSTLPCFWGSHAVVEALVNAPGIIEAMMFGYVVGEVPNYTSVGARYLEVSEPQAPIPNKFAAYMQKAYKIQERRINKLLKGALGEDQGMGWYGSSGYHPRYGSTIHVGVPCEWGSSLVGRIVLIRLRVWTILNTERQTMIVEVEEL